ncbi:MAG: hypothetical protein ACXVJW_19020 [Acidimicrobiia bacterium]
MIDGTARRRAGFVLVALALASCSGSATAEEATFSYRVAHRSPCLAEQALADPYRPGHCVTTGEAILTSADIVAVAPDDMETRVGVSVMFTGDANHRLVKWVNEHAKHGVRMRAVILGRAFAAVPIPGPHGGGLFLYTRDPSEARRLVARLRP